MAFAYADVSDVQSGFEKPIPTVNQPVVATFLARASNRLSVTVKARSNIELRPRWEAEDEESDLRLFVTSMVVDAAERKIRNPGGFSHENAGIFSVSRYDDFAKGRITFDPEDLALLDGMLESEANEIVRGPITMSVPVWRLP